MMNRRLSFPVLFALLVGGAVSQNPGKQDPKTPDGAPRQLRVMPRPQALAVPRGEKRIQVDGVLLDWPESVPVVLLDDFRQLSGTARNTWKGAPDLSARAFFAWDDEDLYVAVVVRDDWHKELSRDVGIGRELPVADSVVLSFDGRRDTRSLGPDVRRMDDRDVWVGDAPADENQLVIWDRYRGVGRYASAGAASVRRDQENLITTYEARIPWREVLAVGQKPSAGLAVDLQIVVNDFDDVGDPIPQTRIGWTFGTARAIDPAMFGALMLVDKVDRARGRMPDFPARPEVKASTPDIAAQAKFIDALRKTKPQPYVSEQGSPEAMGGTARFEALKALEEQLERFPRVDALELHQRIHRRMTREVAGACSRSLPAFWRLMLAKMIPEISAKAPEKGFRIFRLPQGGWFVRSNVANFAIDPAGVDIDGKLGGGCDFVILTQCINDTKRNDQLLVRLLSMRQPRPVYSHVRISLPGVPPDKMSIVTYGQELSVGALKIRVLGRPVGADQRTPITASYEIVWPDRTRLVIGAPQLVEETVPKADGKLDGLVLSAQHPFFKAVVARLRPELVILDDVFVCADIPGPSDPRVRLERAWKLQRESPRTPSLLLAPGETWDIARDE